MKTVSSLYSDLQRQQTAMQVSLLNTRVLLQTGVNLRSIRPEEDQDPQTVAKVADVLRKLGVTV